MCNLNLLNEENNFKIKIGYLMILLATILSLLMKKKMSPSQRIFLFLA